MTKERLTDPHEVPEIVVDAARLNNTDHEGCIHGIPEQLALGGFAVEVTTTVGDTYVGYGEPVPGGLGPHHNIVPGANE